MKPQMDAKTFSIERCFMGCVWPLISLSAVVLAITESDGAVLELGFLQICSLIWEMTK